MIPHQSQPEERDDTTNTLTRRRLLHRSLLGAASIGMGTFLVACGGEEEDINAPVPADNDADQPGEDTGPEPGLQD